MTTEVIIPLHHHDSRQSGQWRLQCRCYPHQRLVETLEKIAGPGDHGLWWTTDEALRALKHERTNWVWVPHGGIDHDASDHYSNRHTHMKFYFKDPNHAVLFKLTWL